MRGMTDFFLDLHDNPQAVERAAGRVNQALMAAIDIHYSIVQPKLGGYGHIFGYWAPGKTIMLQEDALGMCSPSHLSGHLHALQRGNREAPGLPCLFSSAHNRLPALHGTCSNIPGIAGLEMTLETIGPTLRDLVPMFREILERTRLIVHVCTGFEYLPEALRKLPREGLFLVIPTKYIPTDEAFHEFVSSNWKR